MAGIGGRRLLWWPTSLETLVCNRLRGSLPYDGSDFEPHPNARFPPGSHSVTLLMQERSFSIEKTVEVAEVLQVCLTPLGLPIHGPLTESLPAGQQYTLWLGLCLVTIALNTMPAVWRLLDKLHITWAYLLSA